MRRKRIGILCMQETHICKSPYYIEDDFLVILSGSSGSPREFAGVGFVVAPWVRHSVVGFLQFSNRLACLKLRVPHGRLALVSAYAPHSGYSFDERQTFFEDLQDMFHRSSANGLKLIFGDLNSRIHRRLPGEQPYIGDFTFGDANAVLGMGSNRELLIETCAAQALTVANTHFSHPPEQQVTFRNAGVWPMDLVSPDRFGQLDLLLVPQRQLDKIIDVRSHRDEALATQHFLVTATLDCVVDRPPVPQPKRRLNRKLLGDPAASKLFVDQFSEHLLLTAADISTSGWSVDDLSASIVDAFGMASRTITEFVPLKSQRPWISQRTLDVMHERGMARSVGNYEEEKRLHKQVGRSACDDRGAWLTELAGSGS